jgi:integral membrane sensor domain MASE1
VQQQLGFIPTVSLLSFGVAFLLRAPLLPALLTSVVGTVLIYWLFTRLLGVPL